MAAGGAGHCSPRGPRPRLAEMRSREVLATAGAGRREGAESENPGRLRRGFAGAFVAAWVFGLHCVWAAIFFFFNVICLLVFPFGLGAFSLSSLPLRGCEEFEAVNTGYLYKWLDFHEYIFSKGHLSSVSESHANPCDFQVRFESPFRSSRKGGPWKGWR